jgi:hypothetical protein
MRVACEVAVQRLSTLVLAFAGAAALGGCTPTTPYRYSAFVPAVRPIAWDGRAAKGGSIRVEGTVANVAVHPNEAPQVHDTALFVSNWSADASAMIAITSNVELGVRGHYGAYDWAAASAVGTMPLPSHPAEWGFGPELRVAVPLDRERRFALGFAGNVMRYETPYAEWKLTGPSAPGGGAPCVPSSTCVVADGISYYQLYDERSESHITYTFGVYPSVELGGHGDEYGHLFGLLGATNGFKNDGFTDTPTNGSSLDTTGPVWMVGGGYGISVDFGRISGLVYKPLTDSGSSVDYGLGWLVSLGVNAEVFPSGEKDSKGSKESKEKDD